MRNEYQAPGKRIIDYDYALSRLSPDEQIIVEYIVGSEKTYKSLDSIEREIMDKFLDMSELTFHQGVMDKSLADRY